MPTTFENSEDRQTYKNLQYTIVRDVRSFLYEQSSLLALENQEFFMNMKNIKVQHSPVNGISVVFFYAKGDNYGLIYNFNPNVIVLYRVRDNAVIMRIQDEEMVTLKSPLAPNKLYSATKKEPMAVFFHRAVGSWHHIVDKIKESIPTG